MRRVDGAPGRQGGPAVCQQPRLLQHRRQEAIDRRGPEHRRRDAPLQAPALAFRSQNRLAQRRLQCPTHWLGLHEAVCLIDQHLLHEVGCRDEQGAVTQHTCQHHVIGVDSRRPRIHRIADHAAQDTERLQQVLGATDGIRRQHRVRRDLVHASPQVGTSLG